MIAMWLIAIMNYLVHKMIHCIQADSGKFHQHGHRERTLVLAHTYSSVDSQRHSYHQDILCKDWVSKYMATSVHD